MYFFLTMPKSAILELSTRVYIVGGMEPTLSKANKLMVYTYFGYELLNTNVLIISNS